MTKKNSIDNAKIIAEERGGKLLSKEYINNKTDLWWQCDKEHQWFAPLDRIKNAGRWCLKCSGSEKKTIEQMQEIAKSKGGKCLSKEYKNKKTKLLWECKDGHQWTSVPNSSWCPYCVSNKKPTIEEIRKEAKSRGVKLLSTEYKNSKTQLLWECKEGHQYYAIPYSANNKRLCKECASKIVSAKLRLPIEDLQALAKRNGGKLLSTEYIFKQKKLKWQCADGHIFNKVMSKVKNGQWCPKCSRYLNEDKCRYILEFLLQTEFEKTRILLGNGQELDGYSQKYQLAFEYNGIQHREKTKHFHRENISFERQQQRDENKRKLCQEKGIKLLAIPDYAVNNLADWIVNELQRLNIKLLRKPEEINFDEFSKNRSVIKQLTEIAEKRGGKLISKEYKGTEIVLEWKCKNGHIFQARPHGIKSGYWCGICSAKNRGLNRRSTIEEMQAIAKSREGECLSNEYKDSKEKLLWRCKEGHKWYATPGDVKNSNSWCRTCSKKRNTIEEMQTIAKSRGGECLSSDYVNNQTKLRWKCKYGHEWSAKPNTVKNNNSWCRICFYKNRSEKQRDRRQKAVQRTA